MAHDNRISWNNTAKGKAEKHSDQVKLSNILSESK